MEILLLLIGALLSWGITHLYHKRSSIVAPAWAKEEFRKLAAALPKEQLSLEEFAQRIIEALPKSGVAETGSNDDGEWFRYHDGSQTCRDALSIEPGQTSVTVQFPQTFSDEPSVELSGEVSRIISKHATPTELTVQVAAAPNAAPIELGYHARGHWTDPHQLGTPLIYLKTPKPL